MSFAADDIYLEGANDIATSEPRAIKALARLCRRGTRLIAPAPDDALRHELATCGFQLRGEPQGSGLAAVYDPPWTHKQARPAPPPPATHCIVIGGGLAGAAAAASLARRGWQVQVLDQAAQPAAGASGLPAGLMAPHLSPDDNLLSRLSRAGLRITLQQATDLLQAGEEWQGEGGVLEHRQPSKGGAFHADRFAADWSREATDEDKRAAMLAPCASAVVHGRGAWIKPAALVRAWLGHPHIQWRGGVRVAQVERAGAQWSVVDADGAHRAQAPLVVIAAALGSGALSGDRLWLQPVRGQVSLGLHQPGLHLPERPMNGNGHLLPRVPLAQGMAWLSGSSYGRADTALDERADDHRANLERMQALAPVVASQLAPAFLAGQVRAWTGVRCASTDRRPLVGPLAPGLWVSTAMGSRGLTFAALCAELLAARLHGEPLPLPASLALALDVARQLRA